ncbi:hypothetical protein Gogos_001067, partial [Gossypium gossypioides]|nr:hypothetical protein [Gossypium gossypioides]
MFYFNMQIEIQILLLIKLLKMVLSWATLISSLKMFLMILLRWLTKIDGHYSFLKGLDSTIACDLLTGRRSKFW